MSIFDSIEKLITEHGSAAILSQQLAFAKDQFSNLESKVDALRTENADLKAQLQHESVDHKQTREELHQLKEEHAEELRVHSGMEFRRGKRTSGAWIAFCPACHIPADMTTGLVRCAGGKCGWQILFTEQQVTELISKL